MRIKLTNKAERGIGLRSTSTGKLTRYAAGDALEVSDNVAIGLVNSGLAVEVEASSNDADNAEQESQETPESDAEQNADEDTDEDADEDAEQESDADYEAMTKEELVAICKEKGIVTKARDTKEELVAKLMEEK